MQKHDIQAILRRHFQRAGEALKFRFVFVSFHHKKYVYQEIERNDFNTAATR